MYVFMLKIRIAYKLGFFFNFSATKKEFLMLIDNTEQSLTQIVWENRLTFIDKTRCLPYNV